ncbi:aquaporin [Mucilaginibacter robiniae]|uniref:Aquaporin n=2 Tax=Mucilaginibacter robiniae TaxID=2728022 RepID=A0A7L5E4T8_9SPHI|nr:aquaporin [Mucilaginibacter robiniae]
MKMYLAEFIGTALLLTIGLSFVIFDWGQGTPMNRWVPDAGLRRAITGFLFGSTGCLITLSPVGKISGAHINPSVSIAFWLRGKMKTPTMLGYVSSQMLGAVVGCVPLLLWGNQGKSVAYGNTVPSAAGLWPAFIGEAITTACLIVLLFAFVGSPKLRNYTPFTIPFLFSFMVWAEAPLSGCSTNPARSFGPAVISHVYTAYWLFWLAPLTGVVLVVGIFRWLRLHKYYHIEAARISYHNHHSHENIKTSDLMQTSGG